jgi:hypothetical protein
MSSEITKQIEQSMIKQIAQKQCDVQLSMKKGQLSTKHGTIKQIYKLADSNDFTLGVINSNNWTYNQSTWGADPNWGNCPYTSIEYSQR